MPMQLGKPIASHHRQVLISIGFAFLVWGYLSKLHAQSITPQAVNAAIEQGVEFLRQTQLVREGRWPDHENYQSAQTSLVVLALLNCGLSPDDPTVASALDYLKRTKPEHTYEVALQTMALCAADPQAYSIQIHRNVRWLLEAQADRGAGKGGWGYDEVKGGTDPSNSQFGVLALWEAQRSLLGQFPEAMRAAAEYWSKLQNDEVRSGNLGAWTYGRGTNYSGSMTCAGIASLMMAEESLELVDVKIQGESLSCCAYDDRESLTDRGLRWLERNYRIDDNPGSGNFWYYYLYGLERVGRLTGQRLIGNHDWYREGCEALLKRQDQLRGHFADGGSKSRITDTALALLFLSKGKRPVVIGRATTDPSVTLMPRHAIQHLVGHIEQAWKKDLAWQTVSLEQASLEELLEAPVLFISQAKPLQLSPQARDKLKDYVEQGGFIFAEAKRGSGCPDEGFDTSFRQLMQELFETPLQKLSPDHPIWYAEAPIDIAALPSDFWLYGLETCCRTSVVYSPITLACRWEAHRPDGRAFAALPAKLKRECEMATIIGINVATYATGRELKDKLEKVDVVRPTRNPNPLARGMLRLPRLQHSGGAEDTPRAIPNLMEVFKREISSLVLVESPVIPIDQKQLEDSVIVYLSGRRRFRFSESEQEALRVFIQNGGMILGDAVCASQEFAESIHQELTAVLAGSSWVKVPADHPIFTDDYQGFDIRRVNLLNPGVMLKGQAVQVQRYEGPPILEFLMWNERCVAVFSPLDLSCALESRQSTQCRGYPRADAARIAINMLLYSLLH